MTGFGPKPTCAPELTSLGDGASLGEGVLVVRRILVIGVGVFGMSTAAVLGASAWRFDHRLNNFEAGLKGGPSPVGPRADLPSEVLVLARALGVTPGRGSRFSQFAQTGEMWSAPGASVMSFSARQTVSTADPGFLWRAAAGPGGLVKVADYLIEGRGGLEARILGAVTVARDVGSPQTTRGEAMRYLAELPWNPDALLYNRALDWTVVNAHRLRVATGSGYSRAEVTLELNEAGLIEKSGAEARPRLENGTYVPRPWHGRFWNYARVGDRMVPTSGEVAWTIGETDFVYWRGQITKWAAR